MFEAVRADPCRFVELLLDPRSLYRVWRAWRRRGTAAILDEISTKEIVSLSGVQPNLDLTHDAPDARALLVIDATIPQYDRDAGGRSSFLYLETLCEMGYEVFFMPNDQLRREPYASVMEHIGVRLLIGKGFRCGQWKNWLKARTGQIRYIILHRPNIAKRYLTAIKQLDNAKILYFAHDLRCLREARHHALNGDTFHRDEAEYWEKVEKTIISQVDVSYFFSPEETKVVSTWQSGTTAKTVPLFPLKPVQFTDLPYDQRAGLLFVGGFAHHPNLDAVLWFAKEVFPLIRRVLPDIEWHIVGRDPPSEIRNLADPGIFVEGSVSETRLQTLYQTTRLVVAPLRFGAGIKGKVVEAMFHGVPVITTPVGAEGIPDSDKAMKVSVAAEDMAAQILEAYHNPNLWKTMRDHAIQTVDNHFSQQAALTRLSEDLGSNLTRLTVSKSL